LAVQISARLKPATVADWRCAVMGLGVGIVLLAVGAILAFAINVNPTGGAVDLHTIGWILIAVGALGIVLSMVFWSSWAGPGRFTRRTTDVGPTGETSTTTVDQR
jgi:hypothetical protein